MSSSDRLRLVCPLAPWHLFITSRTSQIQQLARMPGWVTDTPWEVSQAKSRTVDSRVNFPETSQVASAETRTRVLLPRLRPRPRDLQLSRLPPRPPSLQARSSPPGSESPAHPHPTFSLLFLMGSSARDLQRQPAIFYIPSTRQGDASQTCHVGKWSKTPQPYAEKSLARGRSQTLTRRIKASDSRHVHLDGEHRPKILPSPTSS